MPESIGIEKFLALAKEHPVIDVRTPDEFTAGHIPGAFNLPVMDNVERAIIGTIYKHSGKQPAIMKGLEFAGPRMKEMIKAAKRIPNKGTFLLHCWRGGMRSGFYAFLLDFYGYKVYTLRGGYKSFRIYLNDVFNDKLTLRVIGGKTGSGKTYILHELKNAGEQILDLENIAHHKGSSFGSLGQLPPPTQEMFENTIGIELINLDKNKIIWVEDESRTIGNKVIPQFLWNQMRDAKMFFLEIPFEKRLEHIITDYGKFPKEKLLEATERIRKRLGNEQCNSAIKALHEDDLKTAFSYSLKYYDKAYMHNVNTRNSDNNVILEFTDMKFDKIASDLRKRI